MVARYAPPISYNFLNLINLGEGKETIFEAVSFLSHLFLSHFVTNLCEFHLYVGSKLAIYGYINAFDFICEQVLLVNF